MNDHAARQYLELVAQSKLAERLLKFSECDDWQDFVLNSLDKAAISAWERVATYRPDIAAKLYPPLWQPEFVVLQKFLGNVRRCPPATDCPACYGAGWLVLATEVASGGNNRRWAGEDSIQLAVQVCGFVPGAVTITPKQSLTG